MLTGRGLAILVDPARTTPGAAFSLAARALRAGVAAVAARDLALGAQS